MKKIIITAYLAIALLISPFYWKWGEYSYMSYGYNLGAALFWPRSLFRSYPEIDGSSAYQFMQTLPKVEQSGKPQGQIDFYESMGYLTLYELAKIDSSVTRSQVEKLLTARALTRDMMHTFLEKPQLAEALRQSLDGMTFGDIVRAKEDWAEELYELVEDRTASTPTAPKPTTEPAQINLSMNKQSLKALNPSLEDLVVDGSSEATTMSSLRNMVDLDKTGGTASSIYSLICLSHARSKQTNNTLDAIQADFMEEGCEYGQDEIGFHGAAALFNDINQSDIDTLQRELSGKSASEVIAMKTGFDTEFKSILDGARKQ